MANDVGRCGSGWVRRISETVRNQEENWEILCHRNLRKENKYGKVGSCDLCSQMYTSSHFPETAWPSGRMPLGCIQRD